jgi:protein involved in ribonucleotide reduction
MERHADTFNFGAKKVSEKYGVELVRCIDLSGTSEDVKAIKEFLNQ